MQQQRVVITGVGRGLGRALATAFAHEGAIVCGLTQSSDSLVDLKQELAAFHFHGFTVDVADPEQVSRALEEFVEHTGGIDALFNNAAVYPKVNFLEELPEDWIKAVVTNLGGASNCCKLVLPHMIAQGKGRIYNLGSWADIAPAENSSAYSTSKGGMHALTKSIARDIESLGLDIEVHEWIPGHLNTRMSDFTGIDPAVSARWGVAILSAQASKKSSIFENDKEWIPPKRLKTKIKDLLFFWKR